MESNSNTRTSRRSIFKRICVFCGSNPGHRQVFSDAALDLGNELVGFFFLQFNLLLIQNDGFLLILILVLWIFDFWCMFMNFGVVLWIGYLVMGLFGYWFFLVPKIIFFLSDFGLLDGFVLLILTGFSVGWVEFWPFQWCFNLLSDTEFWSSLSSFLLVIMVIASVVCLATPFYALELEQKLGTKFWVGIV